MKSIITTLLLITCGIAQAQQTKTIKAKLNAVTVYLKGANLYYTENVQLAAGNNTIIFENISPFIDAATASATSKLGVIMDVRHEVKYQETVKNHNNLYAKELAQVADSLSDFGYNKKDVENQLQALSIEKNMLLTNPLVKGNYQKDSLQLLESAMALVRKKLNEINTKELTLEREKNKISKVINRLNERHNTLTLLQQGRDVNAPAAAPVHRLVVNVYAKAAIYTTVSFSYYTQQAYWLPSYDLQASSTTNKLEMKYFAGIVQTTGLDWDNAKLTVSTSTPTQNNTKPTLNPWQLSFMQYKKSIQLNNSLSNSVISLNRETVEFDNVADGKQKEINSLIDYIKVSENIIRTEYEISLNYSINSDGLQHKVLINEGTLPMALEYAAVPKISADAFLLAKITDWESMNIIPGTARLYFDNSYTGEMYLDAFTDEDTLKFSLGSDKSIALSRKKIKEKINTTFFEGNKVETRTIEITVRNMKNQTIDIELEDQIPVAVGTDQIKITLLEGDGATVDQNSGSLKWKVELKAKKSKKIKFTYEIRYPKDKPIAGL